MDVNTANNFANDTSRIDSFVKATGRPRLNVSTQAESTPKHAVGSLERDLNKEEARETLEQLNKVFSPIRNSVQFNLDEDTGKMVFYLKDGKTGEVIRQIPNEVVLKISKHVTSYLETIQQDLKQTGGQTLPSGLITDTKV